MAAPGHMPIHFHVRLPQQVQKNINNNSNLSGIQNSSDDLSHLIFHDGFADDG